jgi:hypothetical protein
MATIIDAAPIVEPIDKSNSPAMSNSATGAAMMPSSAAVSSQLAVPSRETNPAPDAVTIKKA